MRFTSKPNIEKIEPKIGDKKITTQFLYFPLTIDLETRWWERATFEETYIEKCVGHGVDFEGDDFVQYWKPTKWINNY